MNEPQARPEQEQRRIGTTFTDEELAAMDEWGFFRKIRSRSEVIRRLVRKGLEAERMATTGVEIGVLPPVDADNNNHQEMTDAART